MNRADIYNHITEKIIAKINEGTLPWRKSWKSGLPMNFITKQPYKGINFLSLLTNDYPSQYYITFLQCKNCKGVVNSGTKGDLVVYWTVNDVAVSEEEIKRVPFIRYSYAFNLSQTSLFADTSDELKIVPCEELIASLPIRPTIKHNISRCYYSQVEDYISIPMINDFDSREEYYSALFHELIHWTAHPARLNRQLDVAEEELVAEIGSAYLCGLCGISNSVLENQSSYVKGWLSKIGIDPSIIVRASISAQHSLKYLQQEIDF